jgi:ankyrin repeat protein
MLSKLDDRKRDDLFFKYAAASDLRVMQAFCKLEGFDLHRQDGLGNTALILAAGAAKNHPNAAKVIRLLLDNGADVLAVNHLQETALSAAMTAGATAKEPIRILLEAGSEIMHKNLAGITNYEAAQLAGNESLLPLFDAALKKHTQREVSKIHDGTGKQLNVKRITLKPRKPPPPQAP